MQQNSDTINLLFPKEIDWERWRQYKPDIPFSTEVIDFLNALSVSILEDKTCRAYPDVITFAFFCRRANLLLHRNKYKEDNIRLGRGIVFHIAPSNVPINFAYSLVAGLLSGNYNIVRVSSKEFSQVDLVVKHICELAEKENFQEIAGRIVLVRYDRTNNATAFFSSFSNVRVIWGGDETISQIRKNPIPARSFDVTFADRYSIAVINADELMKETNMGKVAKSFYNDTYLFDQNACSAPHLLIWLGNDENMKVAQNRFWNAVYKEVKDNYVFQSVLAIDKLTTLYRQAVTIPLKKEMSVDNLLYRISLKELPKNIDEFRCAGGYFSEYVAKSLNEIAPVVKENYQTLAYYGMDRETLERYVVDNRMIGIDRIVPIGKTTEFDFIWDGYNLINMLSRESIVI